MNSLLSLKIPKYEHNIKKRLLIDLKILIEKINYVMKIIIIIPLMNSDKIYSHLCIMHSYVIKLFIEFKKNDA